MVRVLHEAVDRRDPAIYLIDPQDYLPAGEC